MRKPTIALLTLSLLAGIVRAEPHGRDVEEAGLAKVAAKIKLYCENRSLEFKIDWRAYESLDVQALVAGEQSTIATHPDLVARIRKYILTGDDEDKGTVLMTGTVTGGAGTAALAFEQLCRDQPGLRAAAAKITTIMLEPINDMTYLADRDKLAFARRTNDWSAVEKAYADEKRDDNEGFRVYRPRFVLAGTTLTITQNVMARSGDQSDFSRMLADVLGSPSDAKKPDDAKRAPPAKSSKRNLGAHLDCDHDYADVATWSGDRTYATGALVFETFSAEPTVLYRCVGRSGCDKDDSLLGTHWTVVGHC